MSSVGTATCVNDATWQTNTMYTIPSFVSTHLRLLGTWLVSLHLRLLGTWLVSLHLGGNISHNEVSSWFTPNIPFWGQRRSFVGCRGVASVYRDEVCERKVTVNQLVS